MHTIKTLSHKGFKAVLKTENKPVKINSKVFVIWKKPEGCIINEWNDHKNELEPLLVKVRNYAESNALTLWSY